MTDRRISLRIDQLRPIIDSTKRQLRRPGSLLARCRPGDRLWVAEPVRFNAAHADLAPTDILARGVATTVAYAVDDDSPGAGFGPRRPAYTMPKQLHRFHLVVRRCRQQPLQSIDAADLAEEGFMALADLGNHLKVGEARLRFIEDWDKVQAPSGSSISGERIRWADNPMVTVLDFILVCAPLDAKAAA